MQLLEAGKSGSTGMDTSLGRDVVRGVVKSCAFLLDQGESVLGLAHKSRVASWETGPSRGEIMGEQWLKGRKESIPGKTRVREPYHAQPHPAQQQGGTSGKAGTKPAMDDG